MKMIPITINCGNGWHPPTMTLDAIPTKDTNLAIHKNPVYGKQWSLIHIPSGYSVFRFSSRKAAFDMVAEIIAAGIDTSLSRDKLVKVEALLEVIKRHMESKGWNGVKRTGSTA